MMHVRLRDRRPTASPIVPVLLVLCLVCMDVPSKTVVLSGQRPSQTAHLKIMALGDSITWGLKDPDYGGYRHLLGTLLANDGYSFEFVGSMQSGTGVTPSADNEGHSGWTIQQIQKGIDSQGWLETYRPDVILLHIGTNDLRPRVGGAASAPEKLSALLDDILTRLPQVRVIVAQIIPFAAGTDDAHRAYNAAIPTIAASKGPRVSIVDMQNILSRADYADGFHPKAVGYDKMARAWEHAIREVVARSSAGSEMPASPAPMVQQAGAQSTARQPRGIYGVFLDTGQRSYTAAIENPAISGLFLYFHWATLEPKEGQFDFSPVEEALVMAESKHKTLQLAVVPGFWTPTWLLDKLASCDGRPVTAQRRGSASPACGKATFGLPEGYSRKGEVHELPLPWNPVYKEHWHAFLVEFAKRFGQRDAFVSIAIAGPTSQSEEIIVPFHGSGEKEKWAQLLEAFYSDPSYHRSNKAFVEEWKAEIDDYAKIFSHVTLALTLAAGLPFSPPREHLASTLEIATYFARQPLGTNAKATQNNGIAASHPQAMRPVMESVARLNPRVLAGGEFGTAISRDPTREGCSSNDKASAGCNNLTLEQAFANALTAFFAGTPYGHLYGAQNGTVPVQYLQMYQADIVYANSHPEVQTQLVETSKRILSSH